MNERSKQITRNTNRNWGWLPERDLSLAERPLHLVLWVTSKCNQSCPHCNQKITRSLDPTYEMSLDELHAFIASCIKRNIHFRTIEVSGGEPSLWSHFEAGLKLLSESKIAEELTFVTNGRDAENVARIANLYAPVYHVSTQQATPEQCAIHRKLGVRVLWNNGSHLPLPEESVNGSLPADCQVQTNHWGEPVQQLLYHRGFVYQCCMSLANRVAVGKESRYCCSFEDSFVDYFVSNKTFDSEICSVCICNNKIFARLNVS